MSRFYLDRPTEQTNLPRFLILSAKFEIAYTSCVSDRESLSDCAQQPQVVNETAISTGSHQLRHARCNLHVRAIMDQHISEKSVSAQAGSPNHFTTTFSPVVDIVEFGPDTIPTCPAASE